jgi:hypothetical protein
MMKKRYARLVYQAKENRADNFQRKDAKARKQEEKSPLLFATRAP